MLLLRDNLGMVLPYFVLYKLFSFLFFFLSSWGKRVQLELCWPMWCIIKFNYWICGICFLTCINFFSFLFFPRAEARAVGIMLAYVVHYKI